MHARSCSLVVLLALASCAQPAETSFAELPPPASDAASRFRAIERVQATELERYAFDAEGSAVHPENGLAIRVDAAARLRVGDGTIRLARWGREGTERSVSSATARFDRNRVEIDRGSLVERFVHGPLGLEQVFELRESPVGVGEVRLVIALDGWAAIPCEDGAVALADVNGEPQVQVAEAYARDARGQMLPVALEANGDHIDVRVDDRDATYPLVVDPMFFPCGWFHAATLMPESAVANYGSTVALDGHWAAVGAVFDRVEIWRRLPFAFGEVWERAATILPRDGAIGAFATKVALGGGRLAIGSPHNDSGGVGDHGYVDVYALDPLLGTWSFETTLVPSGYPAGDTAEFGFGRSVDVDGRILAVGANRFFGGRGLVFLYRRAGAVWAQEAVLSGTPFTADANFGHIVDLSGDIVAIGQPGAGVMFNLPGVVEIHRRVAGAWTLQQRISPNDGTTITDHYGRALALDGDHLVVDSDDTLRAYRRRHALFGETWSTALAGVADRHGMSLSGSLLAVGRPSETIDGVAGAGEVRLYRRTWWGTYGLETTLVAPDPFAAGAFGQAVDADDDRVWVGEPGASQAHAFRRSFLLALLAALLHP